MFLSHINVSLPPSLSKSDGNTSLVEDKNFRKLLGIPLYLACGIAVLKVCILNFDRII